MNIILFIILIVVLFSVALASMSLAPWVPTKKRDLKRILKLAEMKEGGIFYDLGCGDGRVASYIINNSQEKVRAVGLELAIPFYLICKVRQLLAHNKR
ncbi:hypothetical protein ACFLZ9_01530, partial [Patescibacteria group bacterium]